MGDVKEFHQRWCIADGHADSLMWNRDLCERSEEGHVDFPRLQEAGVKLQCFTIVTRGFPFIGGFPVFAAWRGWPREARASEWTRALWQIEQMASFCARSGDAARITTTGAMLEDNLAQGRLSAVLGVEGGHAIEGQVARLLELHQRGVRFMGLTHLSNNDLGGSSFPMMGNRGLTPLGREVMEEMARLGMSVDVAHASESTLKDLFTHPSVRFFCSHTRVARHVLQRLGAPEDHLQERARLQRLQLQLRPHVGHRTDLAGDVQGRRHGGHASADSGYTGTAVTRHPSQSGACVTRVLRPSSDTASRTCSVASPRGPCAAPDNNSSVNSACTAPTSPASEPSTPACAHVGTASGGGGAS